MVNSVRIAAAAVLVTGCQPADETPALPLLGLWANNQTAFGVFVPNERPVTREQRKAGERPAPVYTVDGGRTLAENPLLDYVFLNLEGRYDAAAVTAIATGLQSAGPGFRKALLVRIPPLASDGEHATRARVNEIMAAGADGVVFPHVRSPEEAATAIGMVAATGADIWSPSNPGGDKIAMIMIEDPDALARVEEFADLPGYSVLACGIGSLTRALGGDREAAEAGNREVLTAARRAGLAAMITANARNVEQRVEEGFLALLMQGPTADNVIRTGRAAAGRSESEPDTN